MTLLVTKDTILIKVNFLVGEMSKFLAIGWDSAPVPRFLIKVQGNGVQFATGEGNKARSTEGKSLNIS